VIDELHAQHFRVVLHTVILSRVLRGTVNDRCDLSRYDEEEAGCYCNTHRKTFALGVDGWWPDEGDGLNIASRLTRNRMHWEGLSRTARAHGLASTSHGTTHRAASPSASPKAPACFHLHADRWRSASRTQRHQQHHHTKSHSKAAS
jgi:hypothetical protein